MSGTLIPFGLKVPGAPSPAAYASLLSSLQAGHAAATTAGAMPHHPHPALPSQADLQRVQAAQLYDLTARLRFGLPPAAAFAPPHPGVSHGAFRPAPFDPINYFYGQHDPRTRFFHEEPKPSHSYIGLIAMAILSSKDKKLILSDIYQWILDNYNYFRTRGPGWRNSIRHNLSLNDCFIKAGRAANGKGHYWAIHPAVVEDFEKGDFRRRRAQRKVRKAMGLAVPDEEDSPSPPPPSAETLEWRKRMLAAAAQSEASSQEVPKAVDPTEEQEKDKSSSAAPQPALQVTPPKKRGFDVASLLAPDEDEKMKPSKRARMDSSCDGSDVEVCAVEGADLSSDHNDTTHDSSLASKDNDSSPQSNVSHLLSSPDALSPTASPVLPAWPGRPSAFHTIQPTHPAWRPLLPPAFAMGQHLLRPRPGLPFPTGLPMHAPRILIPASATVTHEGDGVEATGEPEDLSSRVTSPPHSEKNSHGSPSPTSSPQHLAYGSPQYEQDNGHSQ